MPLPKGITDLVEALEERIEVAGHEPTWRVTGGSFEGALAFARAAYDDPVVVERRDHHLLWPRVTLVVTTDPELAAEAPALEELAHPKVPEQRARPVEVRERPDEPVDVTGHALEVFFEHEPTRPARFVRIAPVVMVLLSALAVLEFLYGSWP